MPREVPQGPTGLYELQQPEKLRNALEQDKVNDCMTCRITGAVAFTGLGAYSYFSGQYQLKRQEVAILKSGSRFGMKSRQAGITAIAASLVGMGFWRLIN